MKSMHVLFLLVLAANLATAADTTNLTAVIKDKRVEFSPGIRAQVIQKSIDLLASCAYLDAKPKWGAHLEPQSMADIEKQSHLHLMFSSPVKVEVPIEKVTLQVREMVISLPLNTGGIWVRTDNGVQYLAMFDHTVCAELQKQLDKAKEP